MDDSPNSAPCQMLLDCAQSGRRPRRRASLLAQGVDPSHKSSAALGEAAGRGHAECVKLLIPVCDPLAEMEGILSQILGAGHADILSVMLVYEPKILAHMGLADCFDAADAKGHYGLLSLLLSIIEQQALVANLPPPAPLKTPPSPRL